MLCICFYSCKAEVEVYAPIFECSRTLDKPYGICSHINRIGDRWEYTSRERDLENIRSAGAQFLRADFDWSTQYRADKSKKFDTGFSHFDPMMASVDKYGLRMMGLLSMCRQPQDTDAWKEYVSQVTARYKEVRYWEVVNEVDLVRKYLPDWNPPFVITDYVPLLKSGYQAVKKSNKKTKVLFSSISNIKLEYVDSLFKENVSPYFDIMNVHWYTDRVREPETFFEFFHILSLKMGKYKIRKPVWLTETGASTYHGKLGVDEQIQAQRLPRLFLISFAHGIDKVFWYKSRSCELKDNELEDHFGLWHKDYTPKPAFYAYQTLTKMCPDKSTRPKLTRSGNVYIARWKRPDGKKVYALWTSKEDEIIRLQVNDNYKCYDITGKIKTCPNQIVEITPSILYFEGGRKLELNIEE